MNGSQLSWNGSIGVSQTITIGFHVKVNANMPAGTQFCISSTANYDSNNDGTNDSATNVSTCWRVTCTGFPQDCVEPNCPQVAPGTVISASSLVNDQPTRSVLIYNLYSSNSVNPLVENTRFSLTNTHPGRSVALHLFFVDGRSCAVRDNFMCLTPNQTVTFQASDIDPDVFGYLVVVAADRNTGCPINFNYLMGDEYVKLATGHTANLGATAFAAIASTPAACTLTDLTADLLFDGVHYSAAPRAVAADNLASPQDGNSSILVLNTIGGDLRNGAESIGSVFGLLFDDQERSFSFSARGNCQLRETISNNFPPTSPRLSSVIRSGTTGWLKLWVVEDRALLGTMLTRHSQQRTGGHNLHQLTFTTKAKLTIPVIPSDCQ